MGSTELLTVNIDGQELIEYYEDTNGDDDFVVTDVHMRRDANFL